LDLAGIPSQIRPGVHLNLTWISRDSRHLDLASTGWSPGIVITVTPVTLSKKVNYILSVVHIFQAHTGHSSHITVKHCTSIKQSHHTKPSYCIVAHHTQSHIMHNHTHIIHSHTHHIKSHHIQVTHAIPNHTCDNFQKRKLYII
jgi:hypothetical protein